jgi:Tfp pilus assembly PilM family ATPase
MERFDVTLDEAQHLAEVEGLTARENGKIAQTGAVNQVITEAAAPSMDELVRQISRTLQFTEMQRKHLQPSAIWLMGGGASLKNIDEYLAQELPLPVHVVSLATEAETIPCAAGRRSAMFGSAAALSALAWRAA